MDTHLQESGGLRRTAPIQSPVPVAGGPGLNGIQRLVLAFFLAVLALSYLVMLLPPSARASAETAPTTAGKQP